MSKIDSHGKERTQGGGNCDPRERDTCRCKTRPRQKKVNGKTPTVHARRAEDCPGLTKDFLYWGLKLSKGVKEGKVLISPLVALEAL